MKTIHENNKASKVHGIQAFYGIYSLEWLHTLCTGQDDATWLLKGIFKVVVRKEASLLGSITNNDPSLLGGLNVGLEVTSDTISDSDKRKRLLIEYISMLDC